MAATRLKQVLAFYTLLNLDVVAGAVAGSLLVRKLAGIPLKADAPMLLLALAVFVIYIADRLWDVRHMAAERIITTRHRFYKQHNRLLWWVCGVLTLAGLVVAVSYLPLAAGLTGVGLSLLTGLYLVLLPANMRVKRDKELLVSTLYTLGIWVPLLSLCPSGISMAVAALLPGFWCAAYLNTLVNSCYELEQDSYQGQQSLATRKGRAYVIKRGQQVGGVAVILLLTVTIAGNGWVQKAAAFIILMQVTGQVLLLNNAGSTFAKAHYRWLGDALFLPGLFILLV